MITFDGSKYVADTLAELLAMSAVILKPGDSAWAADKKLRLQWDGTAWFQLTTVKVKP